MKKIVAIKASINRGFSDKLKEAFPNTVPVNRPVVEDQAVRDPQWLAGFTSAEGCFYVNTMKSYEVKTGVQIRLRFKLIQHVRDEQLMKSLIEYFACGNVYFSIEAVDFRVEKFSDLTDKVIPFFHKYPILGVKSQDFEDFCRVAELVKEKKHLTQLGLDEIRKIKEGMNTGRKRNI